MGFKVKPSPYDPIKTTHWNKAFFKAWALIAFGGAGILYLIGIAAPSSLIGQQITAFLFAMFLHGPPWKTEITYPAIVPRPPGPPYGQRPRPLLFNDPTQHAIIVIKMGGETKDTIEGSVGEISDAIIELAKELESNRDLEKQVEKLNEFFTA